MSKGEKKDVDKDAGGGVTQSPAEGQGIIHVILSGNDNNSSIKDTEGNLLKYDPAMILLHEILGHASPRINGTITGNAVDNENKAAAEMGLKLREAEPTHKEIKEPMPEEQKISPEVQNKLLIREKR